MRLPRSRRIPARLLLLTVLAACGGEDPQPSLDSGEALFGSLEVRWKMLDTSGVEKTCDDFGITDIKVAIGGTPQTVPCEQGTLLLESLLPDRYPLVVDAVADQLVRASKLTNAVVTAGERTTIDVTFNLDNTGGLGSARITWRINQRSSLTECGAVSAAQVRITSRPGSQSELEEIVPCQPGEFTLLSIPSGAYELALRLEELDGTPITSTFVGAFLVQRDQLTEPPTANFVTTFGPPTRIVGLWTINSTVASVGCAAVNGRSLVLETAPRPPLVGTSTTVDCALGRAELRDGIGAGTHVVRFELAYFGTSVTSTTIRDVVVRRGQTTTVSVDLTAQ